MEKILISECLYGHKVRYDGQHNRLVHPLMETWQSQGRFIPICPELAGGLPIPRPPAEITQGRVITAQQCDVTAAFTMGANAALELALRHRIRFALMKANSPSCGNEQIYNGRFDGTLIAGRGIAAARLIEQGIAVFNEHQLDALAEAIAQAEHGHIR